MAQTWGLGRGMRAACRGQAGAGEGPKPGMAGGGSCQLLKMSRGQGRSRRQRLALEEWQRRKQPGTKPGQRAEAWEGKGRTIQQGPEALRGRARQLLRAGERHQQPKQSPGNMGKQLKWDGRDGKAENRGFGG